MRLLARCFSASSHRRHRHTNAPEFITVVFAGMGTRITFMIRSATPLERHFATFAERTDADLNGMRFDFDKRRLSGTDSPASLWMRDNDVIRVTSV